ncbi:heavy-metal-associated domain-containing protein [Glutamicibacter creatinolyticus]|uniref:Copper chaperone CopZ n=1 Tax=Glutamicibacter creatinolyticus TaxID=162496 RepID=A0A5B7WPB7_9MICC|nr:MULTISPECIES: heavy-metal-associated domain-containing protein [Micrococcaceae]QCY45858.1 Copper chaperone CopZ [Glutamicibacter creatinolyticus]TLK57307.1 heavy-metal-associated domain-containing protein [Glutamicibacter sp. V16R2B1]
MSTTTSIWTTLRAEGFSCPSCVGKIEKQVKKLDGVTEVKVHFASSRVQVQHDPQRASVQDLVSAIAKAGYKAVPAAF